MSLPYVHTSLHPYPNPVSGFGITGVQEVSRLGRGSVRSRLDSNRHPGSPDPSRQEGAQKGVLEIAAAFLLALNGLEEGLEVPGPK
jgi:hypothetical protein